MNNELGKFKRFCKWYSILSLILFTLNLYFGWLTDSYKILSLGYYYFYFILPYILILWIVFFIGKSRNKQHVKRESGLWSAGKISSSIFVVILLLSSITIFTDLLDDVTFVLFCIGLISFFWQNIYYLYQNWNRSLYILNRNIGTLLFIYLFIMYILNLLDKL